MIIHCNALDKRETPSPLHSSWQFLKVGYHLMRSESKHLFHFQVATELHSFARMQLCRQRPSLSTRSSFPSHFLEWSGSTRLTARHSIRRHASSHTSSTAPLCVCVLIFSVRSYCVICGRVCLCVLCPMRLHCARRTLAHIQIPRYLILRRNFCAIARTQTSLTKCTYLPQPPLLFTICP